MGISAKVPKRWNHGTRCRSFSSWVHTSVSTHSAATVAEVRSQCKSPPASEGIQKMQQMYTVGFYSATKKNKIITVVCAHTHNGNRRHSMPYKPNSQRKTNMVIMVHACNFSYSRLRQEDGKVFLLRVGMRQEFRSQWPWNTKRAFKRAYVYEIVSIHRRYGCYTSTCKHIYWK